MAPDDGNSNGGDSAAVMPLPEVWKKIRGAMANYVIGQDAFIEQLFVALLAGGHCMIRSMPGMARSLTASLFARLLGMSSYRIRCASDLFPADVVLDPALVVESHDGHSLRRQFHAHLVLVDGIDRLPSKTRCMVYQALQDREILVGGEVIQLPSPFMLLATSYLEEDDAPVLPAELRDDRFMFEIRIDYPSYDKEFRIAELTAEEPGNLPSAFLSPSEIEGLRSSAFRSALPPHVLHYALRLVRSTRVHEGENPDFVYEWVASGAGPRAVHFLSLAARLRAAINGREMATAEDIQAMAYPVLRHRVLTNQNAQSTGITVEKVVQRLLFTIPERVDGDREPPRDGQTFDPQDWHGDDLLF